MRLYIISKKGVIYIQDHGRTENLVDYHLHTKFSDDSQMQINNLIKAAEEKNISQICITDHIEPEDFKEDMENMIGKKTRSYFLEIDEAVTKKIKDKMYVKVMTGIELGLSKKTLKKSSNYIRTNPFDFVLASLHEVNGMEINYSNFYNTIDKDEAIRLYLEELYHCIKNYDEFDCLGHLDLIRRYVKRFKGDNDIIYTPKFYSMIDGILKLVIEKGKGIEVNTSGYRYGLMSPMPSHEVIKRFKELGGQIVTIGSDAHSEDQVGEELQNAVKLLLEVGFKYIYTFDKRRALPLKIS